MVFKLQFLHTHKVDSEDNLVKQMKSCHVCIMWLKSISNQLRKRWDSVYLCHRLSLYESWLPGFERSCKPCMKSAVKAETTRPCRHDVKSLKKVYPLNILYNYKHQPKQGWPNHCLGAPAKTFSSALERFWKLHLLNSIENSAKLCIKLRIF